jgi:hypothetical protein
MTKIIRADSVEQGTSGINLYRFSINENQGWMLSIVCPARDWPHGLTALPGEQIKITVEMVNENHK